MSTQPSSQSDCYEHGTSVVESLRVKGGVRGMPGAMGTRYDWLRIIESCNYRVMHE